MSGVTRTWQSVDASDEALADADSIVLQRIDEAAAVARPTTVGTTYVEDEYAAQAEEQREMFAAEGETEARPHQVRARSLDVPAGETAFLVDQSRHVVEDAREQHQHAVQTLKPFTRRDRFASYRYWGGWVFLGLGDAAGVLGAAVILGEIPLIALGQALATGFAAVTSGNAGADLKDLRMARGRQRPLDELSEDELRYRHLFTGMETAVSIMKLVGWLSLTIVLIVTVGIFSLRLAVEGMVSGLAFAALAAATALGSFVSTYSYTDDIADFLAATERQYRKAVAQHSKLAHASVLVRRATADEMARSLGTEYAHRGQAAWWQVRALCQRVLRRNPGVMGHGPAPDEPEVIGRRFRGDAA